MKCSTSSCSSGCGSSVTPCPCPEAGNPAIDSLEKVVSCYWQNHQGLAVERDYYENLGSLTEAIDEAAEALGDENLGYDQPDILTRDVLAAARESLAAAEGDLESCPDFEKLHAVVKRSIGELSGMTPALVYLTALRIGLQAGMHPEMIYLETGARKGCETFVALRTDQVLLARDQLPRIFQHPDLTTEDVQACLTICKHQLSWLSSR